MASIPCTTYLVFHSNPHNFSPSLPKFSSKFLGIRNNLKCVGPSRLGPSNGSRVTCWFKFGKNGVDAEGAGIYGSQSRDDFNRDDVEQYFNYMGMLAVEGTYDKMEALLRENIHPVDILLMLASQEGDKPKIEELLRAGASYTIKDADGRTALDRAANEDIKDLILGFSVQKA
ncbi:protein LHCP TRANSLOCATION DEFECT-like [Tripterygium wilfordii]|uniref:Protein LHCP TRANSLOCATION DEFECT n=1 Tax=Tripterygium wilfordii TaxID=458696 RepID=A0A7J7C2R2_TRIWF|nr:protein LHCP TRANSLOCATION DEFECT [Tripterygium wilfordii]KAF5728391.1 protein LHCP TRANSLOCATION DEFECT-like [Tripterygium wilfordii]